MTTQTPPMTNTNTDPLALAEESLAELEQAAADRRSRLAAVERDGLTASEIRDLSDTVAYTDPAAIEAAREALGTRRL